MRDPSIMFRCYVAKRRIPSVQTTRISLYRSSDCGDPRKYAKYGLISASPHLSLRRMISQGVLALMCALVSDQLFSRTAWSMLLAHWNLEDGGVAGEILRLAQKTHECVCFFILILCLPQASRWQLAYPQTKPSARDPHTDSYSVGTLGIASIFNKSPLLLKNYSCCHVNHR